MKIKWLIFWCFLIEIYLLYFSFICSLLFFWVVVVGCQQSIGDIVAHLPKSTLSVPMVQQSSSVYTDLSSKDQSSLGQANHGNPTLMPVSHLGRRRPKQCRTSRERSTLVTKLKTKKIQRMKEAKHQIPIIVNEGTGVRNAKGRFDSWGEENKLFNSVNY